MFSLDTVNLLLSSPSLCSEKHVFEYPAREEKCSEQISSILFTWLWLLHVCPGGSSPKPATVATDDESPKSATVEGGPVSTGSTVSITVVGASGDLAKKKIFPALFALYYEGCLPKVCLSPSSWRCQFIGYVLHCYGSRLDPRSFLSELAHSGYNCWIRHTSCMVAESIR